MNKYPHAEKFLAEHPGWTLDQCIAYIEKDIDAKKVPVQEHTDKNAEAAFACPHCGKQIVVKAKAT